MEQFSITQNDENWLKENHPDLLFDSASQIIHGNLYFKMYYSVHEPGYVLNPDEPYEEKDGIVIEDVYEIEINLLKQGFLPSVQEVGGRILKSKKKWGIEDLIDMHVYSDSTACLCIPTEVQTRMPNGFNLKDFFENLLIPFFYYQSFFEKYGKEPWRGYSHGCLGILESYLNYKDISLENVNFFLNILPDNLKDSILRNHKIKGHHFCLCKSRKKFRKCHKNALFGYNKLRSDYHKVKK